MMREGLVLAGDRSGAAAVKAYMKLSILIVVIGVAIFLWGSNFIASGRYITSWRSLKYAEEIRGLIGLVSVTGIIFALLGVATPFLAIYQAQKCYIDVYEDHIEGCYLVKRKGELDHYIPFQVAYNQFDGVSFEKFKVIIRAGMESYTCMAFNAEEICEEINKRCQWAKKMGSM